MKRISTHIISLLCLTLFSTTVQGATHTVSKISSTKEIIKGCVYLITYKTSNYYYPFIFQNRYNRDTFSAYTPNEDQLYKDKDINNIIEKSSLIKIYWDKNDKKRLYDIKTKKYLSVQEISESKCLTESEIANDDYEITFYKEDYGFCCEFNPSGKKTYYAIYCDDSYEYGLKSNTNTNLKIPEYYRIEEYGFYLDENTDFPLKEPRISESTTQLPTTATLDITLSNDYYNTLMLPCDVSDYKRVFGDGAEAYEVGTVNSEQIVFTPVEGNSLAADKPYILKGTFNAGPYKLTGITLSTLSTNNVSNGIMTYNFNGDTFNGVYASGTDLKNSDSYVLYNNKFYSCKSQTSMPIRLFRWYYKSGTNAGKRLVIDTNPTGIKTIENSYDVKTDNRFFKLDGTCAGTEYESLPNGIYINNGKKIIK